MTHHRPLINGNILNRKRNVKNLRTNISSFNWDVLSNGTVDEACELFTKQFLTVIDACIPSPKVTIRPDDKPWYNGELRTLCRKRDCLKQLAFKTGNLSLLSKHKTIRNRFNNMKKHAKQIFFNSVELNLCDLQMNDKKGFWRLIRYFVKNNDCSSNIPSLISMSPNGETSASISDLEKAECLNNFFASISSVNEELAFPPPFTKKTNNNLSQITFFESEIKDLIRCLNPNKASGPDSINHRMFIGVADQVSKPLVILFNRSLSEGVFPNLRKMANVIPIYKKGDKSPVTSYRPVSLLSS